MTPIITSPVELRQRGFEALVASLGWVNAVRFIQQYEVSSHDYTTCPTGMRKQWSASPEKVVRPSNSFGGAQAGAGASWVHTPPFRPCAGGAVIER